MLALALAFLARAGDAEEKSLQQIAYDIVQKEMKAVDWQVWDDKKITNWKEFCEKKIATFNDWEPSHGGDKGDYLNQIITDTKGFGVKDGDINALKKFITWLALYQEWQQPLTEKIPEVSAEYRQKLNELISNFSW